MRLRKILIRGLLGLLAVVAAVLLVRTVLNVVEGRRLTRALADLKAQGVPLTVQDLIKTCPDEDNGAVLWKAAEELFVLEGKDIKLLNDVLQSVQTDSPLSAGNRESVVRIIEKNRRALDFIPEVAGKPCFRYGAMDLKMWERRMPNALKLIRAVRLWGLDALMAAQEGDLGGSLDRLRTGLRFAPKNAEESTIISYLIALSNAKTMLLFLNKAVAGREAAAGILAPLLDDLDERYVQSWKTLLQTGIRGERVMFLNIGLPPSPKTLQQAFGGKSPVARFYYWLIQPLIRRDCRMSLPIYAELESQALLPYYRTRDFWKPYKDRLASLPWYALVSKMIIPEMEATFLKVATLDALVLTARAGLACRIFKARTGNYPETLEALVPELLDSVPIDPFTGKPVVYRREGKGFIVYSLGSNEKDDGGRSTWNITQLVMDRDDDWTWKELW